MNAADSAITVVVNGETRAIPSGVRLDAFIDEYCGARGGVAVAIDGEVVPRAAWPERELAEGARIEILTAVQGG